MEQVPVGYIAATEYTANSETGGIIVLALFVNGWSVDKCAESFEQLAKLAFQSRPSPRIPILSPIANFLVSFFADGRYSPDNLEAALQDTFGHDRSILDCSRATAIGTRIGLPVTTIRDVSTYVFTNYNGVGARPLGCGESLLMLRCFHLTLVGYHVLCPGDGLGRVPLWEMYVLLINLKRVANKDSARCGSAAPS